MNPRLLVSTLLFIVLAMLRAIPAAAEPYLVVGGVDACRMDIDDDLARPRCRVGRLAEAQHLGTAMPGQQYRFHRPSSRH